MAKYSDAEVQVALAGRKATRSYPFPGNEDMRISIRGLSGEEMDNCRLNAADYCKKKKAQLLIDPDFLEVAIKREVVAAAMRDPDNAEDYFFAEAAEVAQLDAQTTEALYQLYMMHHEALDPYAYASQEEVDGLVQQLGKSETNEEPFLKLFESSTLRRCVITLASMLRETQQRLKSATG